MRRMGHTAAENDGRLPRCRLVVIATVSCLLIVSGMTSGCGKKYEKPEHYKGFDSSSSSLSPKMGRQTNWILQQIEATDEQRSIIKTNMNDIAIENAKVTKEYKMLMDRLMEAFEDEHMDRHGFEKIRDNSIQQFKMSSDRMVNAVAAIHEELTPEQRRKVAELWRKKSDK